VPNARLRTETTRLSVPLSPLDSRHMIQLLLARAFGRDLRLLARVCCVKLRRPALPPSRRRSEDQRRLARALYDFGSTSSQRASSQGTCTNTKTEVFKQRRVLFCHSPPFGCIGARRAFTANKGRYSYLLLPVPLAWPVSFSGSDIRITTTSSSSLRSGRSRIHRTGF